MQTKQVIIDRQQCTGCGACVAVCPYRVISLSEGGAVHSGADCFLCDHCRAVCPQGAISLPALAPALGLASVEENSTVIAPGSGNLPQLVALMRSRRSCRSYREKAIPLDTLLDLVKIGTTAPSGTNSQGWNFVILPSRDNVLALGSLVADFYRRLNRMAANPLLRGLARIFAGDSLGRYQRTYYQSVDEALRDWDDKGQDRLFHGATAAILVTGGKNSSCPAEDALLATENILLAAHAMGLGSCLIGFAVEALRRTPPMRRQLEIAGDERVYSVIALGYPTAVYLYPAGRRVVQPRVVHLAG